MRSVVRFGIVALVMSIVSAGPVLAREESALPVEGNWGTVSDSVLYLFSGDFTSWNDTPAQTGNGEKYCASGNCFLLGDFFLPSGAVITAAELEACDFHGTYEVGLALFAMPRPNGFVDISTTVGSGATPGCSNFLLVLDTPHTVDNQANGYVAAVYMEGIAGAATRFRGVRIYYRLQVKAAPLTATYSDVPVGHALHQFVEALSASGITVGCGGGNFCPNAPVTRGQMAVFLAKALGLHWTP